MEVKKEFIEPTIKEVVLESRNIICCSPGGDYEGPAEGDDDEEVG